MARAYVCWINLFVDVYHNTVTVYAGFRRYLSSSNSGEGFEFAIMPNSLSMLVHSLEFVCIHKPRAISIIYTPYLSFNPVAVKRYEAFDNRNTAITARL